MAIIHPVALPDPATPCSVLVKPGVARDRYHLRQSGLVNTLRALDLPGTTMIRADESVATKCQLHDENQIDTETSESRSRIRSSKACTPRARLRSKTLAGVEKW